MEKFRVPEGQTQLELKSGVRNSIEKRGYFFCIDCKGQCEDIDTRQPEPKCKKHDKAVQWIPPRNESTRINGMFEEENGSTNYVKKNLTEMCFKGFHQCLDCGQITKVKDDKCVLCGSTNVKFNTPTLATDINEKAKTKNQQ